MNISQQDKEQLKNDGYSEDEIQQALMEVESSDLQQSQSNTQQQMGEDPRQNTQLSSFATRIENDLVKWQLELNDILERAEHILRGDVPVFKGGHIVWDRNKFPEQNCLSEYGVQELMKILSMYVNRNTILSDYTNHEINLKVYDFGRELNNLIFMRYTEFGMDTVEKRKHYPILVRKIVDIVHSSYKRALDGAEKRSLREMINISQATNNQMPMQSNMMGGESQQFKQRGLLNPLRYIKPQAQN